MILAVICVLLEIILAVSGESEIKGAQRHDKKVFICHYSDIGNSGLAD